MPDQQFDDEFHELCQKHCIETFTLIWRDPDSSNSLHMDHGELLWNLGAIEAMRGVLVQRYVYSTNEQEDVEDA